MEMNVEKKSNGDISTTVSNTEYGLIKNNCRMWNISTVWLA